MKQLMMKLSVAFLLLLTTFVCRAQISGTNSVLSISPNTATVVDPGLTISGSGEIQDMTIQITGGYISGASGDILTYTGSLPSGVATSWDNVHGILRFYGFATIANWQTLLRTVTLQTTSASCFAQKRNVTFVLGSKLYNPSNGHFYEKSGTILSWAATKANAEVTSYFGRKGYLTTITTEDENDFVWQMTNYAFNWMGGSDNYAQINAVTGVTTFANQNASEGNFYWLTGPESGTPFSIGDAWNSGPNSVSGRFSKWTSGQPDDYPTTNSSVNGEQDFTLMYGASGEWDDENGAAGAVGIFEYGDMPNDVPVIAHSTRNIAISSGVSSGTISGGDVSVCPGSNSTVLTLSGLTGSVVRWESSLDNNFLFPTTITNTTNTYTVTNISKTMYFRAIVNSTSPASCSNLPTSSTKITVAKTIPGNILAASNSVCTSGGGSNAFMTLYGNYTNIIKWQSASNSTFTSGLTNIANTTAFYNPLVTANTTIYYRAIVQNSSCGPDTTSGIAITGISGTPSVGGSVDSKTFCGGSNSGTLTLSGKTGSVTKWQLSSDNGIAWSDIANTATTNSFTNITATTLYRSVVTNGSCPSANSSPGMVEVTSTAGMWIGGTSEDWQTGSNWCGGVPALTTDVIVPSGPTFNPKLSSGTGLCKDLTIRVGGTLTVLGNTLQIAGNVASNGTLSANNASSVFEFKGSTPQAIAGTNVSIRNIIMNNASGVTCNTPVNLPGILTLTSGVLYTTTTNMLTMGSTSSVSGGGNASHVNGPIQKKGTSSFIFPLGKGGKYAPCQVYKASAFSNNTWFTAEYFNTPYSDLSVASGLNRVSTKEYWQIDRSAPVGTPEKVDVVLFYYDKYFSGIADINPTDLIVAHYNGTDWEDISTLTNTSTSNSVTLEAVDNFSPFTFGSLGGLNPLPVSLINFNAIPGANKSVDVIWQTASEENNKYFEVMYSSDLINWKTIGIVKSKGTTSNEMNNYMFRHTQTSAANYYKLKQVDNDGKYAFSDIKVVRFAEGLSDGITVYPNPSIGTITIKNAIDAKYEVIDMTGKVIMSGSFNDAIELKNLPKGLFLIKIESETGVRSEKIVVQ